MKKTKVKTAPLLVADDVGMDPSHEQRSRAVKVTTSEMARRLGAAVDLVHIEDLLLYPINRAYYKPMIDRYMAEQKGKLAQVGPFGEAKTRTLFPNGHPVKKILELSGRRGAYEMLVVGTKGRTGLGRIVLGSVSEEIIRNARVPVMTLGPKAQQAVPSRAMRATPKILVGTDLGKNSLKAEAYALSLAKRMGAELVFFHCLHEGMHPVLQTAFSDPTPPSELRKWGEELRTEATRKLEKKAGPIRKAGLACSYVLDSKTIDSGQAILAEVEKSQPDLVILGTHGRTLVGGAFFGSTAREVILNSPAPVITVRSS